MFTGFWTAFKSPTTMAILAVIGFGLAIFQGFFYERKGELTITNDAVSRVFDIYHPVGGLEVSYAGENLRTSKKALWTLSFTVKNSGNAEIRKGDYDDQVPFGFQFVGAEVVELPTIKTNVEYLSRNLKITKTSNFVGFSPVIFEPNDEVQINVLLLGSDAAKPTFSATGKIAGLRSITMNSPDKKDSGKSFWSRITEADDLWVHPVRSVIYGFGGLMSLAIFIGLIAGISTPFERLFRARATAKRRKESAAYKPKESLDSNSRSLLDIYVVEGKDSIVGTAEIVEIIKRRGKLVKAIKDNVSQEQLDHVTRKTHPLQWSALLAKLKEIGLVTGKNSDITYSDGLDEAIGEISQFLNIDLKDIQRGADLRESGGSHDDYHGVFGPVTYEVKESPK